MGSVRSSANRLRTPVPARNADPDLQKDNRKSSERRRGRINAIPHPTRPSGCKDGLFNSVNDSCGPRIEAALGGLQPEPMAETFRLFARKLAKKYCHLKDHSREIRVNVEVVPYNS